MEQLQVYNPNTGEWCEIKHYGGIGIGDLVMKYNGAGVTASTSRYNTFALTPIPTPVWATLGKEAMASVKPELQPRVTGEFRQARCEWVNDLDVDSEGAFFIDGESGLNYIILSPPPAPQKTANEIIVNLLNTVGAQTKEAQLAVREAIEHLKKPTQPT